jgi:hypothetical protein
VTWSGRAAQGWARLVVEVALVVAACVLLQIVAERTNRRIDLTPTRALSLATPTRAVLAEVTEPLTITVFHRRGEREAFAGLLERLRDENPRIAVALFDLDRYPERARGYGVTQYGRAAIEYRGRRVVVPAQSEEALAGGILEAVRGRRRRAVFTTGHGERTPDGSPRGVGRLVAGLEEQGFTVDAVNLLDGALPPETDLVIVAGPQHDLLPQELLVLGRHLEAGGGLLLLLEPGPLPSVDRFLAPLGIALGTDIIVDYERRLLATDGLAAVVEQFRRGNPISEPARNPIESGVVLPSARTVDVGSGVPPGVAAESIARTAPSAWAMADAERARRGEEPSSAAGDVRGPLSVMVLAEVGVPDADRRPGRLLVIGDVDFASDAYLDLLGNRDIAFNAAAWTGGEEALAGARPHDVPEVQRPLSPLVLTESQARRLFATVAGVLPGLMLLTGIVVVTLRRRNG